MDPFSVNPSVPELIEIWQSAMDDIYAVCAPLSQEQWQAQTPCPGWTVADIVAHAISIESFVGGEPAPDHVPDWDALPHATGPLSQFIETGIDYRRGRSKDELLDELRTRTAIRRAQLDALPPDAEVMGLSGSLTPLTRVVRTRTFDLWAHEQDIRTAIGDDGHWGTPPAVIAFQQMASALPFVWGKGVSAPASASVQITVQGPELEGDVFAVVGDDGKAVAADPLSDPTVRLVLGWPDYMRVSCGRVDVTDPEFRARISVEGDHDLAEKLLDELTITP